jgi:tRNA(Ile)-lysidine synthase
MEGRKKVFDIMGEMGLTRAAKARLPLVCDMVGPVWIPGGPIAERAKVTPETHTRLVLRLAANG